MIWKWKHDKFTSQNSYFKGYGNHTVIYIYTCITQKLLTRCIFLAAFFVYCSWQVILQIVSSSKVQLSYIHVVLMQSFHKIFCYGIYVTNSSKMRMISWKNFLLPSMVKKMKMQMKPMHEIYHTLNKMGEMTYALFMLQLCCTGSIHTTSCSLEWSSLISLSRVERISSSSTRRLDFSISSMLTWLACNGAVYEENRAAE